MSASREPYPYRCPGPLGVLRLSLTPDDVPARTGLWWPYSRDLTREGPHLVNGFPERWGRIDRLVYSSRDWADAATELFTDHGRMKVGYFPPGAGRGAVLLRLAGAETLTLQVRWPDDARLEQHAPSHAVS